MGERESRPTGWQRAFYLPLTILAWLAVLIVGGWLLGHVARTLLVLGLSGCLALALTPLVRLLPRRVPRPIAIGVAYGVGGAVVLGLIGLVILAAAREVISLANNLPSYVQQAQSLEPALMQFLEPVGVTPEALQQAERQALARLQAMGTAMAGQLLTILPELGGALIDVVMVLILSVYMAANGPRLTRWLQQEMPRSQRRHALLLVAIFRRVVGGYIRGMLTLATLIGVLVGGGLWVLQVPYAALLGVLAFFMEFVPVIGVFISGAASILVALLGCWNKALLVLAYFVVIHVIEGDLVGPRIIGPAVGIHPAVGLIALLVGTELFGIWGALFAAPAAGLVQAIVTAAWLELRQGEPQAVAEGVAKHQQEKAASDAERG